MGEIPAAVDDYADIPATTRERLKARMEKLAYDDIVTIRRDRIDGNFRYGPELRDMHFGTRRICGEVTRKTWRPEHEQRGFAYCEDGHCIVVPLVCRNVSRIARAPAVNTAGGGSPHAGPMGFDPPSAGIQPLAETPADPDPVTRVPLSVPPAKSSVPPGTDAPLPSAPLQPLPPGPAPGQDPGPPPIWPTPVMPPLPPAPAVPEPATALLWAMGLGAVICWSGWRRALIGRESWKDRTRH